MAQVFIPIAQAAQASMPAVSGCASAASCSSASSCGSGASCGSVGADDPETRLEREGWVRRTTIGEPRLSELAENYRAMGYEVHVEYFADVATGVAAGVATGVATAAGGEKACTSCFDSADRSDAKQVWGTVFVRRGRAAAKDDELF